MAVFAGQDLHGPTAAAAATVAGIPAGAEVFGICIAAAAAGSGSSCFGPSRSAGGQRVVDRTCVLHLIVAMLDQGAAVAPVATAAAAGVTVAANASIVVTIGA